MADFIATADVDIRASSDDVWKALTDPALIAEYFFGSQVDTDWTVGSPITWKGAWEGKPYEDKGKVLRFEPQELLSVSHFSPLTGLPDSPENYHTLTYRLEQRDDVTHVSLEQDNNHDQAEADRSAANWRTMLDGLKKFVEGRQ